MLGSPWGHLLRFQSFVLVILFFPSFQHLILQLLKVFFILLALQSSHFFAVLYRFFLSSPLFIFYFFLPFHLRFCFAPIFQAKDHLSPKPQLTYDQFIEWADHRETSALANQLLTSFDSF